MRQKFSSILFPILVLSTCLPASASGLSADDLKSAISGLTNAEAQTLSEKGQVTRFFESNGIPRLVPNCSLSTNVNNGYDSVDHTVGVEALFVMKQGDGSHDERMLRWYNVLRSISTMKGIQYYSVTHGRMRVLFRDSYVIDNPTDQNRRPDPLVAKIPKESTLTIKQDDSTFGEALFHLQYRGADDAISMSMVNLSSLYLWFIPVITKKNMILQLVLMPYKGNLLFYGGVEVKTISLFGLQNATRDSFVNRIEALHRWFEDIAGKR